MEIRLTQGKIAHIDDEDWPLVAGRKWYAVKEAGGLFYAAAMAWDGGRRRKTQIRMHRLIIAATPGEAVDHKDGDTLNNTRANLRPASVAQNAWNSAKIRKGGTSRYKGVSWITRDGHWRAQLWTNGGVITLGRFGDEVEAAKAYDAAASRLFGEFARLNFPNAA